MKIAILSDVHDHRDNLSKCITNIQSQSVDHIIHLWDYGAPSACVKPLVELRIPLTGIRWNNDGEAWMIMKLFEWADHAEILRTNYGQIELWSTKIFMTHYDDLARIVALSWEYDLVLYGHNHRRDSHLVWDTLVANPGAIYGDRESASYAIYDTETHLIVHIELMETLNNHQSWSW